MRLPAVVRRYDNALAYGLLWLPYIGVYQLLNRFPLFEPRELEMTALDRAVPFLPELLPVYVAYIPFYWWTVARSRSDEELRFVFRATHLQLALAAVVWLLFPVTMPRELFYTAETYNWADAFWRWFDAPNNCLPSLHAANGLLFVQFHWQRPARALHTAMALAIVASTVLVKQHYVVDVLAGAAVYLVVVVFLGRLARSSQAGVAAGAAEGAAADGAFPAGRAAIVATTTE